MEGTATRNGQVSHATIYIFQSKVLIGYLVQPLFRLAEVEESLSMCPIILRHPATCAIAAGRKVC